MKKIDIKVEVFFTPANIDELLMRDKTVVVIDVLRSSTSIVAALNNGAREIIPVASIENAVKVSGSLFDDVYCIPARRFLYSMCRETKQLLY